MDVQSAAVRLGAVTPDGALLAGQAARHDAVCMASNAHRNDGLQRHRLGWVSLYPKVD